MHLFKNLLDSTNIFGSLLLYSLFLRFQFFVINWRLYAYAYSNAHRLVWAQTLWFLQCDLRKWNLEFEIFACYFLLFWRERFTKFLIYNNYEDLVVLSRSWIELKTRNERSDFSKKIWNFEISEMCSEGVEKNNMRYDEE